MLVGEKNRIPYTDRLLQIFGLIGAKQGQISVESGEGGVDVAEDLRLRRVPQLFAVADVDLRAQLLSLIAVEDAQRNADIDAEIEIDGRITAEVEAEGWVGRSVRFGQFVVGVRLVDSLHRGLQVGSRVLRDEPVGVERVDLIVEVEDSGYVEFFDWGAVVQKHQQLNAGRSQIHFGGLQV